MKTITATIPAWLPDHRGSVADLLSANEEAAVGMAAYYRPFDDDKTAGPDGWVFIGMAEIKITLDDEDKIITGQVASLRAAKRKVQADCEVALNQLEGQIQSLLAIESK